jgi:ABC-type molybdate transport system substrate-binding protein
VTTQSGACDVALVPVITAIKAGGTFQVLKNAGTLPVEILSFGKNLTSNAERFMTFLNTDQAREIWRKWGFETPGRNEANG